MIGESMGIIFDKVKGKLGFGCMRLPLLENKEVDIPKFIEMVDYFMESGFNYFDTAHGYIKGKSETALRAALTSRYSREDYVLTNKLSTFHFTKNEEIRPLFESQLEACGVDYFDFYLMHSQDAEIYRKYTECRAYETAAELLKEGKIRHLGISFHDKADVLDRILTDHPEVEVVQIQFNYADYNDSAVQSRGCYEVARRHGKPIIVMEPVKGGKLVDLPEAAKNIFRELGDGSEASYAIRFAAGFDGIFMTLSGMGNMDMMRDNVGFMKNFEPLSTRELEAVERVCDIFKSQNLIQCTACRYCVDGCPKNISIPDLFACLNGYNLWKDHTPGCYYEVHTDGRGKAGDCIECGLCESVCPQHLPIRELLRAVSEKFDKK